MFGKKLGHNLLNNWFYRDDYIKGSEVPILVLFCSSVSGPHNENVFSRCKSKLIVISNEDQAHKIVPSKECDFARIIPVYGKFYIQATISLFYNKLLYSKDKSNKSV